MDEDLLKHDFMGRIVLNLADYVDAKPVQKWFSLKPRTEKVYSQEAFIHI